jgi:hypothetical protein
MLIIQLKINFFLNFYKLEKSTDLLFS